MDYLIAGIQVGFIYALVSLGIVLVYRATRILNFAHPDFATFGIFIAIDILDKYGDKSAWVYILAGGAGAILSACVSFIIYFFIIYEGQKRGVSPLGLTIVTIGIAYFFQSLEIIIWGADPKAVPHFVSGKFSLMGIELTWHFAVIVVVSLTIMFILYLLIMKTRLGIALRAISQNLDASRTLGINVRFVVGFAFFLSSLASGIAGILIAPVYSVDQFFLFDPFLKAFIGAVIGGLDSPPGAIIGSLIVGITESLFGGYVSIKYKTAFIFFIGLIFLGIRPEGIFGKEIKERV